MPETPSKERLKPGIAAAWMAFANENGRREEEEKAAQRAKQPHPYKKLGLLTDGSKPMPLRFYGPGPDGRVKRDDPPVGTLHYARYRHERCMMEDPDGEGYEHEENPVIENGRRVRPTYTTTGGQPAPEVNFFRWEKVPAETMKSVVTFPGLHGTYMSHEEYLLNEVDFNELDTKIPNLTFDLGNRLGENPKNIYPLGYKLLKKWSKVNGYEEWKEGQCLGAEPYNPHALTKHLGWFPKRLRRHNAGLGADPQDAIWKEVFHGNLHIQAEEPFVKPRATWSEDATKVMTLTSSADAFEVCDIVDNNWESSANHVPEILDVLSLTVLITSRPFPEASTLEARKALLAERKRRRAGKVPVTNNAVVGNPGQTDPATDNETLKAEVTPQVKQTVSAGEIPKIQVIDDVCIHEQPLTGPASATDMEAFDRTYPIGKPIVPQYKETDKEEDADPNKLTTAMADLQIISDLASTQLNLSSPPTGTGASTEQKTVQPNEQSLEARYEALATEQNALRARLNTLETRYAPFESVRARLIEVFKRVPVLGDEFPAAPTEEQVGALADFVLARAMSDVGPAGGSD